MAINLPGPYEVEILYTVETLQHSQKINVDVDGGASPGDLPATIDLVTKSGGNINVLTALAEWVVLLEPFFNDSVTIDECIVWKYDPGTTAKNYITSFALGGVGSTVTSTNRAHQLTFTFRTFEGGIMKIVLLEDTGTGRARTPYSGLAGGFKALMDYVFDDDTWMLARDTSYPISPINSLGGENERVFKRRFRA